MCQQIKNVFKLIFYIKGIPQNFCPSEALRGSWQASYPFRASQQASYLFRASPQASVPIQGLLASLNPHSGPLGKPQSPFRASWQASIPIQGLLASLNPHSGPLGKPQSPFRAPWQASIPIQGLLASFNPHSGPLGKSQALLGPPGKPQALFRALKELFSQDSLDEPKLRTLCNLSLSLYIYQVKKKLKYCKTIINITDYVNSVSFCLEETFSSVVFYIVTERRCQTLFYLFRCLNATQVLWIFRIL